MRQASLNEKELLMKQRERAKKERTRRAIVLQEETRIKVTGAAGCDVVTIATL